jgi:hypothetical protein
MSSTSAASSVGAGSAPMASTARLKASGPPSTAALANMMWKIR